jgi:hypothetical protein
VVESRRVKKVPGDDNSHMGAKLEGVGIGCGEFVQCNEEFNKFSGRS